MISINTAKSVVNCYLRITYANREIYENRSEVRQFVKWLKTVLDISIPNDMLLNNRSMDELLPKLASSINLEDVDVLARLCIVYEEMTNIHLGGLLDQIRSAIEFDMNDFLDNVIDNVADSIDRAKDEQWAKTKKRLGTIPNEKDVSC